MAVQDGYAHYRGCNDNRYRAPLEALRAPLGGCYLGSADFASRALSFTLCRWHDQTM
jgi:hypothetical protein